MRFIDWRGPCSSFSSPSHPALPPSLQAPGAALPAAQGPAAAAGIASSKRAKVAGGFVSYMDSHLSSRPQVGRRELGHLFFWVGGWVGGWGVGWGGVGLGGVGGGGAGESCFSCCSNAGAAAKFGLALGTSAVHWVQWSAEARCRWAHSGQVAWKSCMEARGLHSGGRGTI
jgi:hypothetical protein